MLSQSEWNRRVITICAVITVCLCVLATVGVMCYRVLLDGNTAVTNDITGKLTIIAISGFLAMVGALFGSNSVIGKLLDKVTP